MTRWTLVDWASNLIDEKPFKAWLLATAVIIFFVTVLAFVGPPPSSTDKPLQRIEDRLQHIEEILLDSTCAPLAQR